MKDADTPMILTLPLLAAMAMPVPLTQPAHLQVGPNPSPQQASPLPIPRRRRVVETAPGTDGAASEEKKQMPDRLAACLATGRQDLTAGLASARLWRDGAKTDFERTRANQCLGLLLNESGDYAGAEGAFAAAVATIPPEQAASSFQLLGMAGNAALAGGHADKAVDWFDQALALKGVGDNAARASLQTDRARALVAAGRMAEAGGALDEAHRLAPEDAEGWLLSATLARRGGDLDRAQRDIEVAAAKDPRDPAIGLEAGVIAVLAGRDVAAMKSWDSVIKAAPNSPEAKTARGYLEQLGPVPTSSATASAPAPGGPAAEKKATP
ncbi:tetratricopeptide repeat protein [Novosphingobium olei]|uniref:Tetratricopeptide repeat protein n=1 Tax=Novosphingobium olei TaxID=2728851 RepID=A0A7Y0GAI4_9SPHN|nr:hypothetical protein [Novosphingobium olei]NML95301.1 hypothetical protein [Novosphingobium olei]